MAVRITIGKKMAIGFGVITLGFLFFIFLTHSLLRKNDTITHQILNVNLPSETSITELRVMLFNSKMLLKNWIYIDQKSGTPDKIRFTAMLNNEFPALKEDLLNLKKNWAAQDTALLGRILVTVEDTLFVKYIDITHQLNSVEAYQDPMVSYLIYPMVEDNGEISIIINNLIGQLNLISSHIQLQVAQSSSEAQSASDSFQKFIILYGAFIVILSVFIGFFLTRMLITPLTFVKQKLLSLAEGELFEISYDASNDEIGDMIGALKRLTSVFYKISVFANEIGKGNYTATYKALGKKDVLGNALIDLKNSLENATKDAEERREIDRISNWTTNGLANFAELLRKSNNISVLAKSIVTELVNYMEINQGGIFIINDEDPNNKYLEMLSCYAYGRDRYAVKHLALGEGIVGTAFLEKETVVMTEVPDGYTEITSGLGAATPSSIMVVPLKTDDQILGVMELASFNVFKDFEIEFVQRIATSIATTIANVKVAEETSKLLLLSKEQTETMKSQEDMMKQNIEELEATQEEAAFIRSQMEEQLREARAEIEQLKSGFTKIHVAADDDNTFD